MGEARAMRARRLTGGEGAGVGVGRGGDVGRRVLALARLVDEAGVELRENAACHVFSGERD